MALKPPPSVCCSEKEKHSVLDFYQWSGFWSPNFLADKNKDCQGMLIMLFQVFDKIITKKGTGEGDGDVFW